MKTLNLKEMEMVEGGFRWSSALCDVQLAGTLISAAAGSFSCLYGISLMMQSDCFTGSLF